jgi:hypothetical protein
MLSHQKKAIILARTGTVVPPFPVPENSNRSDAWEPGIDQARAIAAWNRIIDALFVDYAAARAAKSLRDSEYALQLEILRRANIGVQSTSR